MTSPAGGSGVEGWPLAVSGSLVAVGLAEAVTGMGAEVGNDGDVDSGGGVLGGVGDTAAMG
jgi:hypothetical protein